MTRVRAVAPLLAAAVMAVVAVATVQQAGCDSPGRYEFHDGAYTLVGGCVAPGDLAVHSPPEPLPTTVPPVPSRS
ncbi:MAG: hypothetical protein OJJ54_15400 [Pseudonocardia sp.]|nr:hypothetical protein [Pseudonocardia sp.]